VYIVTRFLIARGLHSQRDGFLATRLRLTVFEGGDEVFLSCLMFIASEGSIEGSFGMYSAQKVGGFQLTVDKTSKSLLDSALFARRVVSEHIT
jgi:hypothetical protein